MSKCKHTSRQKNKNMNYKEIAKINNVSYSSFTRYESPNIVIVPTVNKIPRIGDLDRIVSYPYTRVDIFGNSGEQNWTNDNYYYPVLPEIQNSNNLLFGNGNVPLNIAYVAKASCADSSSSNRDRTLPINSVTDIHQQITKASYSKYQFQNNLVDLTGRDYYSDKTSHIYMDNLHKDNTTNNINKEIIIDTTKEKYNDKHTKEKLVKNTKFKEVENNLKHLNRDYKDENNYLSDSSKNYYIKDGSENISKPQKRKIESPEALHHSEKKLKLLPLVLDKSKSVYSKNIKGSEHNTVTIPSKDSKNSQREHECSSERKYDTLSEAQIRNLSPGALKRYLDYQRFLRKYLRGSEKRPEETAAKCSNCKDNLSSDKNKGKKTERNEKNESNVKVSDVKSTKKDIKSITTISSEQNKVKKKYNTKPISEEPEQMNKKITLNDKSPRHSSVKPSTISCNRKSISKEPEVMNKKRILYDKFPHRLNKKEKKSMEPIPSVEMHKNKEQSLPLGYSLKYKEDSNKKLSHRLKHKDNKESNKKLTRDLKLLKTKREQAHTDYLDLKSQHERLNNSKINKDCDIITDHIEMNKKVLSNMAFSSSKKEKDKTNKRPNSHLEIKMTDHKKVSTTTNRKQESNKIVTSKSTTVKGSNIETQTAKFTERTVNVGEKTCSFNLPKNVNDKADLRAMLIRKKKAKNDVTSKRFKTSKADHDNLIVTVKQDVNVKSKTAKVKNNTCNPKIGKTKKVKLVINIECCSTDSDDSNQTKIGRTSPSQDLSFLDDFDVDEIVDSLNIDVNLKALNNVPEIGHVTDISLHNDSIKHNIYNRDKNMSHFDVALETKQTLINTGSNYCDNSEIKYNLDQNIYTDYINKNESDTNVTSTELCDDVYEVIDIRDSEDDDTIIIEHDVEELMKEIFGSPSHVDINQTMKSTEAIKKETTVFDVDDDNNSKESLKSRLVSKIQNDTTFNSEQTVMDREIQNLSTDDTKPQNVISTNDSRAVKIEITPSDLKPNNQNITLLVEKDLNKSEEPQLHLCVQDNIQTRYGDSIKVEETQIFKQKAVKTKAVVNTDCNSIRIEGDPNIKFVNLTEDLDKQNHEQLQNNNELQNQYAKNNLVAINAAQNEEKVDSIQAQYSNVIKENVENIDINEPISDIEQPHNKNELHNQFVKNNKVNTDVVNHSEKMYQSKQLQYNTVNSDTDNNENIYNIDIIKPISGIEKLQNDSELHNQFVKNNGVKTDVNQNVNVCDSKKSQYNADDNNIKNEDEDEAAKGSTKANDLEGNNLNTKNCVKNNNTNSDDETTKAERANNINNNPKTVNKTTETDNAKMKEVYIIEKFEPEMEKTTINNESESISNNKSIPNTLISNNNKEEAAQSKKIAPEKSEVERTILSNVNNYYLKRIEEGILEILHKEIKISSLVHRGYHANIYKYKEVKGGTFAIKILKSKSLCKTKGKIKMLASLRKLTRNTNDYILEIINSANVLNEYCLLMDYYPKNLEDALKENKRCFHIDLVQKLSKQLVSAVATLTNNQIIHADIKPNHILLNSTNDKLRLCGFDRCDYNNKIILTPGSGTVNYRAPEIILGFTSGHGVDVWATALVIYEMATGTKLFPGYFNNDILYKQLCTLHTFNYDILKYCTYAYKHFCGTEFMRQIGSQNWVPVPFIQRNNILKNKPFHEYNKNWRSGRQQLRVTEDLDKIETLYRLLEQMLVMDPRMRLPIAFVAANEFILDVHD